MRTKHVLLAFVAFFALGSCAAEQPAWQITARQLSADNCPASACSCLMGCGSYHEYCRAITVLHITDGNYGNVSLGGQNIGLTSEFTGEGTTYMAFYIDEAASDEVKEALRGLLSAKPFGVVGDGFGIKETSITFAYEDGKESSFSIGDFGTMTLTPMIGGDGKSQMKIVNPTSFFPAKEVYLSSAKGKYSDYGKDLTLEHHSGEVSVFTLSGGGE